MKRILMHVILIVLGIALVGCSNPTPPKIEVKALQEQIEIGADQVADYNYKGLFSIKKNNKDVEVLDEYLNISDIQSLPGSYVLMCTYESKTASVIINVTKNNNIKISSSVESIDIKNVDVFTYDYKSLFVIYDGLKTVEVEDSYLDLSNLRASTGSYIITCTYQEISKSITVNVSETEYQLKLSTSEIIVKQSEVLNYDFNSLFTVVVDGKVQTITSEMVSSNVSTEVGTYQYIVTVGELSRKLTVNVIADFEIEIINSFKQFELEEELINSFDYTTLFSIYVDGESRNVTMDMIDTSSLEKTSEDNIYQIKITYTEGLTECSAECSVKVVPTKTIKITPKNIVTYPNGEYIDLTSLFKIEKGDVEIPVTSDMITGSINYETVGENQITLTYNDLTAVAIVEVKQGVIINYAKTDTINIGVGLNQTTYAFEKDFVVLINGIRFNEVEEYINTENVDFSKVGVYTATIEIPYTDSSLGITKGTLFTKEITYNVIDVVYDLKLNNTLVTLPSTTTKYDPFTNISLKVNGINQKLTTSESGSSSPMATYAQVVSDEIDYGYTGYQLVKVAIYVYGPSKDPIYVEFNIVIESSIVISSNNLFLFEGTTIYTKDLFTIKNGTEEIEITQDMIEGKVDTHKPGIYNITLTYQGMSAVSSVVVVSKDLVGTYNTRLETIPTSSSSDEEGYEDAGSQSKPIGKMYIAEDGRISVDGTLATILYGIDKNTLYIKVGPYEFTLSYENGIIVLVPENEIKLQFINNKRPLIYFDESKWEILDKVVINTTDQHILHSNIVGYTIDAFKIKNLEDNTEIWYGLKTYLFEKMSSDTIYEVTSGEVKFADDFVKETEISSSLVYDDQNVEFKMVSESTGKVKSEDENITYKYANMVFNGEYNGQTAKLVVSSYEGFTLQIGNTIIFNLSGPEIRSLLNGGIDYENDEIMVYEIGGNGKKPYAHKLLLDVENKTFTYVEKDVYYGKYEFGTMYFFLDGYGTGIVNFDTTQYAVTQFEYSVNGNELRIDFINTKSTFKHGDYGTFYIDELCNTLTAKYFVDETIQGKVFENTDIIDGALVHITSYTLGVYSNKVLGRKALFDLIEIFTKDGKITDNGIKTNMIDISDITFAERGFYHFSITINVNGKVIVLNYAIQIK